MKDVNGNRRLGRHVASAAARAGCKAARWLPCGRSPETVMLDFVQPQRPPRWFLGFARQARRDEAGGQGTRQHDLAY